MGTTPATEEKLVRDQTCFENNVHLERGVGFDTSFFLRDTTIE